MISFFFPWDFTLHGIVDLPVAHPVRKSMDPLGGVVLVFAAFERRNCEIAPFVSFDIITLESFLFGI